MSMRVSVRCFCRRRRKIRAVQLLELFQKAALRQCEVRMVHIHNQHCSMALVAANVDRMEKCVAEDEHTVLRPTVEPVRDLDPGLAGVGDLQRQMVPNAAVGRSAMRTYLRCNLRGAFLSLATFSNRH